MKKIILFSALIISAAALTVSLIVLSTEKKVCYVDNGRLYDGFDLKKEYEQQLQTLRMGRKNKMDSLEFRISQLRAQANKDELAYAQEYFMEKARQYEEEEDGLLQEYNSQIWKRLNQYATDFGKEKHIDILLGTSGSGNVLYAKPEYDITKELISYANTRYHGKK